MKSLSKKLVRANCYVLLRNNRILVYLLNTAASSLDLMGKFCSCKSMLWVILTVAAYETRLQ
jgi:hypothetical protein